MDIATANLIFLDKIERHGSDLLKVFTDGVSLAPDFTELIKVIDAAATPAANHLENVAAMLVKILDRMSAGEGGETDESGANLAQAVMALQNAITIQANRAATDLRSAVLPVLDSHGKLLDAINKLTTLLSKKRKYAMKIDRNHQTKLIQGVEIIETEGE